MKLYERLSDKEIKKLKSVAKKRKKKHKKQPKRNEQLTRQDIEELMGVNRPTYKRGRGGALRQR